MQIARRGRRDQRGIERAIRPDRTRLVLAREIPRQPRDQRLGLLGVRIQHPDDILHGHGIMRRMPAVEIGDHRHAGVADLGFAGELGFGHVGHADHRIALRLVGQAFR
ncbi:hypothetical protein chiPu_0029143, partial [Chiloscyllium punctatum]|nr:hypothetical protein [Chiloscyllium punctatum]